MKGIDPRGPRFGAAITSVVLAAALISPSPWSLLLAGLQWIAFAVGAFAGVRYQPYGVVHRRLVAPRLEPPGEMEDPRPPPLRTGCWPGFCIGRPARGGLRRHRRV